MKTRTLGRTSVQVSALGFGAAANGNLNSPLDDNHIAAAINQELPALADPRRDLSSFVSASMWTEFVRARRARGVDMAAPATGSRRQ